MALINVNEVKSAVGEAVKKTNAVASRRLRSRSRGAGWPQEAGISVDILGDSPVSLNQAAEDAEYGTIKEGPRPVVRGSEGVITNTFEGIVRDELRRKGLVL